MSLGIQLRNSVSINWFSVEERVLLVFNNLTDSDGEREAPGLAASIAHTTTQQPTQMLCRLMHGNSPAGHGSTRHQSVVWANRTSYCLFAYFARHSAYKMM